MVSRKTKHKSAGFHMLRSIFDPHTTIKFDVPLSKKEVLIKSQYYEEQYRTRVVQNLRRKAQAFGFQLVPA